MSPFPFYPLSQQAGLLLFGVWLYDRWNHPGLAHACALELMALEAQ